ncbi:HAD hydrolase-like protein [Methylobacterium organophilum]|uniref:Phosphoglycolate phosphatase n=1 Tax=Methylobacterium organophilum TaxID=410 RepID=A0ABQ4T368_METOR|nr:HAD hydrolase-like protein [Methylobacterium organophilum]UMY19061.1 HAD hydrolase-like protein [Methylobacterium organophilum]GJE25400.1 Phosphoglycolate phosphatase [Methylobacterium organophilum]
MDAVTRPACRLVVFDFDGTLADTFPWFCGVLNEVADRFGFRRVAAHEIDTLRGLDAHGVLKQLGVPLWKVPAIARHMHGLAARDAGTMRLFPGIPEMLAALQAQGLALALLSSNTEANVRRVLGPEAAARIGHYACGAALFGKARRLQALLRRCGVPPGAALSIGDEIRDWEAARAVGCRFGAVGWGYTRADALAARGPDLLLSRPEALLEALVPA